MPKVVERMNLVSRFRRGEVPSKKEAAEGKTATKHRGKDTVKLADYPQHWHVTGAKGSFFRNSGGEFRTP
jgi:hypothetical protein